MTTVSVLIPTFNGAAHLRQTIDSVLAQQGVDFELIVVDNNSQDGTAALVASYTDSRIHWHHNASNLGAQGNWNRALGLATGTYIKLLPHDDPLEPDALVRQVRVLEQDRGHELALVFGSRRIIGPNGRVWAQRGLWRTPSGRIPAATLRSLCVRRGTNVVGEPGAVMFRRSLAQKVGLFDGQQGFVIDLDYWLRLLAHGDGWYLSDPVCAFRVSKGSWSVAIGKKQCEQYMAFLDRMNRAGLVHASRADLWMARFNAQLGNLLRRALYKVFVR